MHSLGHLTLSVFVFVTRSPNPFQSIPAHLTLSYLLSQMISQLMIIGLLWENL